MFSSITKGLKDIESKLSHIAKRIQNTHNSNNSTRKEILDNNNDDDVFEQYEIPNKLSELLSSPIGQINLNQEQNKDPIEEKQSILTEIKSYYQYSSSNSSKLVDIAEKSYLHYLDQYEPLPRKYINDMYYEDEEHK